MPQTLTQGLGGGGRGASREPLNSRCRYLNGGCCASVACRESVDSENKQGKKGENKRKDVNQKGNKEGKSKKEKCAFSFFFFLGF